MEPGADSGDAVEHRGDVARLKPVLVVPESLMPAWSMHDFRLRLGNPTLRAGSDLIGPEPTMALMLRVAGVYTVSVDEPTKSTLHPEATRSFATDGR